MIVFWGKVDYLIIVIGKKRVYYPIISLWGGGTEVQYTPSYGQVWFFIFFLFIYFFYPISDFYNCFLSNYLTSLEVNQSILDLCILNFALTGDYLS